MTSALNLDVPSGLQFGLLFLYLVLAQVSFLQLSRLIYNKHPLLSFQAWFLLVSFFWCGERAVTFIWSPLLSQAALTFLWVIPSAFQCISFSLLVLYSRFLLNQHRWSKDRFCSLLIYFSLNIVISIITITIASLLAWPLSDSDGYVTTIDKIHTALYSVQFTVLLGLYGYYAYHLHRSISTSNQSLWHHQQSTTSSQFWVSLIAWTVFFTQWLYYVLATIDPAQFRLHISAGSDNILDIQWPVFLVIVVWEVVPTALVLFVSRQIPSSEDTLLTEIRYHGFFKAVFCCPTTRSRRGLGNGMLYENLTSKSIFGLGQQPLSTPVIESGDGIDGPNALWGLNPNALGVESIFSNGSNLYPHQASYHVLNNDDLVRNPDGTVALGQPSNSLATPSQFQMGASPNSTAGLMMDYGLVDASGGAGSGDGDQRQQQQQKQILQRLQSYSNHVLLNESMASPHNNSDLRGLPVVMSNLGTVAQKQLQPSQQQQQPQQINMANAVQQAAQANQVQANSITRQGNPNDLVQMQIKSQLNPHLAAYNYDDGGDLF